MITRVPRALQLKPLSRDREPILLDTRSYMVPGGVASGCGGCSSGVAAHERGPVIPLPQANNVPARPTSAGALGCCNSSPTISMSPLGVFVRVCVCACVTGREDCPRDVSRQLSPLEAAQLRSNPTNKRFEHGVIILLFVPEIAGTSIALGLHGLLRRTRVLLVCFLACCKQVGNHRGHPLDLRNKPTSLSYAPPSPPLSPLASITEEKSTPRQASGGAKSESH